MVEKRFHPLLGLLWNQTLIAFVSFIIVTTMKGTWQQVFGLFFFWLYLSGVYGYAKKAGLGHNRSYSTIRPHIKFPFAYALVALGYFLVPLGIAYLAKNTIVTLIVIMWEAPFYFGKMISLTQGIRLFPIAVFGSLIFVAPFLGYWAGLKGFSVMPYIVKLLYRPIEENSEETK